jgi:hypothetical protein
LAFDGQYLVVDVMSGDMERFDRQSGAVVDTVRHGLQGWVTAIAPAWRN